MNSLRYRTLHGLNHTDFFDTILMYQSVHCDIIQSHFARIEWVTWLLNLHSSVNLRFGHNRCYEFMTWYSLIYSPPTLEKLLAFIRVVVNIPILFLLGNLNVLYLLRYLVNYYLPCILYCIILQFQK